MNAASPINVFGMNAASPINVLQLRQSTDQHQIHARALKCADAQKSPFPTKTVSPVHSEQKSPGYMASTRPMYPPFSASSGLASVDCAARALASLVTAGRTHPAPWLLLLLLFLSSVRHF
eukprot:6177436-Pleurochrysis_carterae.AAC.2